MSTDRIVSQVSDRVALITLNRPEVLNAFEDTMREELLAALERAANDRTVRCVMITGAGRAFCAGGDIASMAALQADNNDGVIKERMAVGGKIIRLIRGMAKPVVAAVNGAAAGAGMNLALGCDLRLGADTARFAESFVKIGLIPDWAGFSSLPRLVGTAKALELMLTGERIDAAEALRLGLLNRVYPHRSFRTEALEFARRLAAGPPQTLAHIKRGVCLGASAGLEEILSYERDSQAELFLSADAREGMCAFLEKRPPAFGKSNGSRVSP